MLRYVIFVEAMDYLGNICKMGKVRTRLEKYAFEDTHLGSHNRTAACRKAK